MSTPETKKAEALSRTLWAKQIDESRLEWRRLYGRYWQLRWENNIRRPSWRVDMEIEAWRQMRQAVKRYAILRRKRRLALREP